MAMIIFDYQHLVYKTMSPNIPVMSVAREVDGVLKTIITTIPAVTIKSIWNNSGRGALRCGVCLEGGSPAREQYFQSMGQDYKGGRKKLSPMMRKGVDLSIGLMVQGGVSCYRKSGFESDDFVYTLVKAAKVQGYTDPIYVVTNDHDLMPLVDNQVSVYMKATRTYRVGNAPEIHGYFQITPETWDDFVSYSSRYGKAGKNGFDVPYNSVILYKLLRGDDSDNIKGIKGYGAVKFNKVVSAMRSANMPFDTIFRYENCWEEILMYIKPYFTEAELVEMAAIYDGIRLKQVMDLNEVKLPSTIQWGKLQGALSQYDIQIKEPY